MDFLKRHYEKVILVGLIVGFIVLMIMAQLITSRTQEVKDSDLEIPKPKIDYDHAVKPDDPNLDPVYKREHTKLEWPGAVSRDRKKITENGTELIGFSDLVNVFAIAACPYCPTDGEFKSLIPLDNFSTKEVARKCPKCGHDLPAPLERKKLHVGIRTDQDLDGDGIPNEAERKFGMNPEDPDDALYDDDHDGFSNLVEFENGTDPRDPGSHPPFWWRLRLKDVKQIELPVRFKALNDNNSKDKKDWEFQFNIPNRRRKGGVDSEFCRIGDTLEIEGREYRVDDVVRSSKQVKTEGRNAADATRTVDTSKVFLTEIISDEASRAPDKLEMTIDQPAYSSDKRPVLEDLGYPVGKEYILRINDTFFMGLTNVANYRRDRTAVRYQLKSVDMDKKLVRLVELSSLQTDESKLLVIEISTEGKVSSGARVVERRDRGTEAEEPLPGPSSPPRRPGARMK